MILDLITWLTLLTTHHTHHHSSDQEKKIFEVHHCDDQLMKRTQSLTLLQQVCTHSALTSALILLTHVVGARVIQHQCEEGAAQICLDDFVYARSGFSAAAAMILLFNRF